MASKWWLLVLSVLTLTSAQPLYPDANLDSASFVEIGEAAALDADRPCNNEGHCCRGMYCSYPGGVCCALTRSCCPAGSTCLPAAPNTAQRCGQRGPTPPSVCPCASNPSDPSCACDNTGIQKIREDIVPIAGSSGCVTPQCLALARGFTPIARTANVAESGGDKPIGLAWPSTPLEVNETTLSVMWRPNMTLPAAPTAPVASSAPAPPPAATDASLFAEDRARQEERAAKISHANEVKEKHEERAVKALASQQRQELRSNEQREKDSTRNLESAEKAKLRSAEESWKRSEADAKSKQREAADKALAENASKQQASQVAAAAASQTAASVQAVQKQLADQKAKEAQAALENKNEQEAKAASAAKWKSAATANEQEMKKAMQEFNDPKIKDLEMQTKGNERTQKQESNALTERGAKASGAFKKHQERRAKATDQLAKAQAAANAARAKQQQAQQQAQRTAETTSKLQSEHSSKRASWEAKRESDAKEDAGKQRTRADEAAQKQASLTKLSAEQAAAKQRELAEFSKTPCPHHPGGQLTTLNRFESSAGVHWRVQEGVCYLSGRAHRPNIPRTPHRLILAQLPEFCRPAEGTVEFAVPHTGVRKQRGVAEVIITADGAISVPTRGGGVYSFDSIAFTSVASCARLSATATAAFQPLDGFRPPRLSHVGGVCVLSGRVRKTGDSAVVVAIADECRSTDGSLRFGVWANRDSLSKTRTGEAMVEIAPGSSDVRVVELKGTDVSLDGMMWSPSAGQPLALASGWSNTGKGYRSANVKKVGSVCILSGCIFNTVVDRKKSSLITTLPDTCRPSALAAYLVNDNTVVDVHPDGRVTWASGAAPAPQAGQAWLWLDGIHFVSDPRRMSSESAAAARVTVSATLAAAASRRAAPPRGYNAQQAQAVGKPIKLVGEWVLMGSAFLAPSFRVINGVCLLSGVGFPDKKSTVIGQLPPECAPAGGALVFSTLFGGPMRSVNVQINTDGTVELLDTKQSKSFNAWLTFDGISFPVSTATNVVSILAAERVASYRQAQVQTAGGLCIASGVMGATSGTVQFPTQCTPTTPVEFVTSAGGTALQSAFLSTNAVTKFSNPAQWQSVDGMLWLPVTAPNVTSGSLTRISNLWDVSGVMVYKVGDLCVMAGRANSTSPRSDTQIIARLPYWCRPVRTLIFAGMELGHAAPYATRVDIKFDGSVQVTGGNGNAGLLVASFSSVHFVADPRAPDVEEDTKLSCQQFWDDPSGGCPHGTHKPALTDSTGKNNSENVCAVDEMGACVRQCCQPRRVTCDWLFSHGGCPNAYANLLDTAPTECTFGSDCRDKCCRWQAAGAGKCGVWGDPHVISYDGLFFDCDLDGEFVYHFNAAAGEDIRAVHSRLASSAAQRFPSFVSGVGIRQGASALTVMLDTPSVSTPRPPVTAVFRFNGAAVPYPTVKAAVYGDFEIRSNGVALPSHLDKHADTSDSEGAWAYVLNRQTRTSLAIRFRLRKYFGTLVATIDFHISNAWLKSGQIPTTGLCGTWDGSRDDLKDLSGTSCSAARPDDCCRAWSIPRSNSIFLPPVVDLNFAGLCTLAASCPTNWKDFGEAKIAFRSFGGAPSSEWVQGPQFGTEGFEWRHPRVCCAVDASAQTSGLVVFSRTCPSFSTPLAQVEFAIADQFAGGTPFQSGRCVRGTRCHWRWTRASVCKLNNDNAAKSSKERVCMLSDSCSAPWKDFGTVGIASNSSAFPKSSASQQWQLPFLCCVDPSDSTLSRPVQYRKLPQKDIIGDALATVNGTTAQCAYSCAHYPSCAAFSRPSSVSDSSSAQCSFKAARSQGAQASTSSFDLFVLPSLSTATEEQLCGSKQRVSDAKQTCLEALNGSTKDAQAIRACVIELCAGDSKRSVTSQMRAIDAGLP